MGTTRFPCSEGGPRPPYYSASRRDATHQQKRVTQQSASTKIHAISNIIRIFVLQNCSHLTDNVTLRQMMIQPPILTA